MVWKWFKKKQREWIKRAARVRLLELHGITLELEGHRVKLANISISGLGVKRNDALKIDQGQTLKALLRTDDQVLQMEVEVRHIGENLFGLNVLTEQKTFAQLVEKIFSRELAALSMREVRQESVKQDERGLTRWWNGGQECDFYLIVQGDKVVYFNLYFHGHLFNGGEGLPTIMGEVEHESDRFKNFAGSDIIKNPKTLSDEMRTTLEHFFSNVPNLEVEIFNGLCVLLNKSAS